MSDILDRLHILDPVDSLPRVIDSTDNLQVTATWQAQNKVAFDSEVAFSTEYILLNDNYVTAAAQTVGFVSNYLPTATADTVDGAFTAGVAATSNPTVVTAGSATFSLADIILVTGAANPLNNGVYEVLSHTGTTLTIRGIGTTATVEDFTKDQFVADTTVQGSITKINISVLRSGTDGNWESALGSTTPLTFNDFVTANSVTLQSAYENGNTITTDAGNGSVTIAGTETFNVTTAGGLNLDTVFDFDGTSFDVLMSGANGFSIDGGAASNVSVDSGNLTLSTTTTGSLLLSSVGDSTYTIPANSATAFKLLDGAIDYINIDSTTGAEAIDLTSLVNLVTGAGVERVTSANLVAGNLLSISQPSGQFALADADTTNLIDGWVVGVSRGAATAASTAQAFTVSGSIVPVLFSSAPLANQNGRPVYLSVTAGEASMSAPGSPASNKVVFIVGTLAGGDGVSTLVDVIFNPQFISRGSQVS